VGARSDTLTVTVAGGGVNVLTLGGNAISQLTASPATIALIPSGTSASGATPQTQTVTIANRGGADATLGLAFLDFGVAQTGRTDFRTRSDTCTGTLAAGTTCTVGVQMFTDTLGTRSTSLVATNSANGQSATVVVSGTAAAAILQLTPATGVGTDFGTVLMGDTSGVITYTVRNVGGLTSGPVTFGIYDQVMGDGGVPVPAADVHDKAADFPTTGTTCGTGDGTLAPGLTCDIKLAFHPTLAAACDGGANCVDTRAALAEFLVVTASPGTTVAGLRESIVAASVLTNGVAFIRDNSVPPKDMHDFGLQSGATTATFTLYNGTGGTFAVPAAGTATFADITGITGAVTGDTEFSIPATGTGTGTCAGFGRGSGTGNAIASLAAGETCTFRVTWTPGAAAGTRAVGLTVTGVSRTLVLNGHVAGPAVLTAKPSAVDFGNVSRVGIDSPTQTVTITNTGESATPADLQTPTVVQITSSGCRGTGSALSPGEFCVLTLDVQPTAIGAGTANVVVRWGGTTTAADSVTIAVAWTAADQNPVAITRNPTSLDFGPIPVLATSTEQTVTVRSVAGNDPTGPLSFTVNNADYAVKATGAGSCGDANHADGLTPSASASDSCTVALTFTPRPPLGAAPDDRDGALTITSKYLTTPVTVALTGRAIAALGVVPGAAGHVIASTAQDPLVTTGASAGCTFTDATASVSALCAYGTRTVGLATFRSETFSFQNAAGSPATGLLEANLTGTDAGQYKIVYDTCTGISLQSTDSPCKVTVRFAPTTASTTARAANLVVSGSPGDSVTVRLTGTGG
jgi:hypothetical protein